MLGICLKKNIFGRQYNLIDEELNNNGGIKELTSIRGFSKFADWKGKQLLAWLFFYGIPFLKEYCDQKYSQNLIYLSNAVFLLSKPHHSSVLSELAQNNLDSFSISFEAIYGEEEKGPNFHELMHIVQAVKLTGQLYVNSTFNFEQLNFEIRYYHNIFLFFIYK